MPEAIDPKIVADRMQVSCTLADQRRDQVFRDTAEPEATNHHGGSVRDAGNGGIRAGEHLIHEEDVLRSISRDDNSTRSAHPAVREASSARAALELVCFPIAWQIMRPAAATLWRSTPVWMPMPSSR